MQATPRHAAMFMDADEILDILREAHDALMEQPGYREITAPDGTTYHVRTFSKQQAAKRRDAKRRIRKVLG